MNVGAFTHLGQARNTTLPGLAVDNPAAKTPPHSMPRYVILRCRNIFISASGIVKRFFPRRCAVYRGIVRFRAEWKRLRFCNQALESIQERPQGHFSRRVSGGNEPGLGASNQALLHSPAGFFRPGAEPGKPWLSSAMPDAPKAAQVAAGKRGRWIPRGVFCESSCDALFYR